MKIHRELLTGVAAAVILTMTVPFPALAEQPPLFQYEGENLQVTQIGQYDSGQGEGGTEIMAYDADRKLAFVTNGAVGGFDILSFEALQSNQFTEITSSERIFLSDFGLENVDDITSIASHPTKDLIAISAVSNPKTDAGYIVFATKAGEYVTHVQVGSLPDMVTFTPDGSKAIVANEGEPSDDYSVDPEGSISIIDVSGEPADFTANTLTFDGVDLDEKVRTDSEGSTLQQLEPEYVSVNNTKAFISMQENNAIATVDLFNEEILHVKGLGMKDHSIPGNELDAKDNQETNIEKQPLLGFYMPDAIDTFTAGGKTYILTPNEGDARDYDGYSEEGSIGDIKDQIQLNADHYQGYTQEELDQKVANGLLDELEKNDITLENGKNEEGIYESLHSYGGRSFSIFDAESMELVYDSGSDFESIIAEAMPEHFNTNNDELEYDGRSDGKGPEPETVVSGKVNGTNYAFVALERFSGIMIYDLTNPLSPEFVTLISSRDFSEDVKGDVSPEGLQFISASESPTGRALLAATHEISGTVAVYEFGGKFAGFSDVKPGDDHYEAIKTLTEQNIVKGLEDGSFGQWDSVERQHVAAMLFNALELEAPSDVEGVLEKYNDVNSESMYAKEIAAVTEAGVFRGDGNAFNPNVSITREQVATILVLAFDLDGQAAEDVSIYLENVSPSHKENVQILANLGLTNQVTDFRPKEEISRGALATLIYQAR